MIGTQLKAFLGFGQLFIDNAKQFEVVFGNIVKGKLVCKITIWICRRNRMFYGQGLELHDINIGKKQFGFRRARESDPLEPLYPTETMETPEMSKLSILSREDMSDLRNSLQLTFNFYYY